MVPTFLILADGWMNGGMRKKEKEYRGKQNVKGKITSTLIIIVLKCLLDI